MAWTGIKRPKYRREGLRYASDTTDEEWALIEPHLPPPASRGRTRETDLRDAVNAISCIAQSGCQWRMLPKDFPPYSTVQPAGRESQSHRRRDRQPVGQDDRIWRTAGI
jgi:transposase